MTDKESEFHPSYSRFANTLRGWIVGFGIGGPLILMTNDVAFEIFVADISAARSIAMLYLAGCAIQILLAFIYMLIMSYFFINETAVEAYNKVVFKYRYKKMNNELKETKKIKIRKVLLKYNQPYYGFLIIDWVSESWKLEMFANALSITLLGWALLETINLILPVS